MDLLVNVMNVMKVLRMTGECHECDECEEGRSCGLVGVFLFPFFLFFWWVTVSELWACRCRIPSFDLPLSVSAPRVKQRAGAGSNLNKEENSFIDGSQGRERLSQEEPSADR